jgi:hypothetical protein
MKCRHSGTKTDITAISQQFHSAERKTSMTVSNFAILVINIMTLRLWNGSFVVDLISSGARE